MKIQINRTQYFTLFTNLIYGKAVGITSAILARHVGNDNWISMTIGGCVTLFVVWIITYLGAKFPDQTIVQYSQKLVGVWLGRIIGLGLCLFFIIAFTTSANTILFHAKPYLMPETPFIVLVIGYVLICAYGLYAGIEAVLRLSFFGFLMAALLDLVMIVGVSDKFKLNNLLPLLDQGLGIDIAASIYGFTDFSMLIFGLGFLYPLLNNKTKIFKLSFFGTFTGLFLILVWQVFEIGVMGKHITSQFVVSCMQLGRVAQVFTYLPRYELVMMILFVWGMIVQSVVMFYGMIHSFMHVFQVKKEKHWLIPFMLVNILATYFLGKDQNWFADFLSFPWSQITAALTLGLPSLLLILFLIRKGKL